jgi:drug/metabolite transporter (DMT)-like permease
MESNATKTAIPGWLLLIALLAGNVALALGAWFVRLVDTGPVAAGFWRLALALPILLVFAQVSSQRVFSLDKKVIGLALIAGLFFASDVAAWHVGIGLTRLGNAVLFANSGSLVLMAWGFIVIGALPKTREWIAMASALGGGALLLGRSLEISTQTLIGDLLSLLAGMLYAGYLLILHDARRQIGSWSLLFWTGLSGAPFLLILALSLGEAIWPSDWTPILLLVFCSQIMGQGLLVFALRHFSPLIIGLALLTQPVTASIVGWLAFGEILSALDFLGMALVGSALVLARIATGKSQASTTRPANASHRK